MAFKALFRFSCPKIRKKNQIKTHPIIFWNILACVWQTQISYQIFEKIIYSFLFPSRFYHSNFLKIVKQLYGKSSNVATTTETSFRPLPGRATTPRMTFDEGGSRGNIELCESDGKIDTMFTGPDNKAYVFKGLEMISRYLLTNSRVSPFYLKFCLCFSLCKTKPKHNK